MFESRNKPLLPRKQYFRRVAIHIALGLGLILAWLFAGMLGYHDFEKLNWLDAFLNASMILSGMGPVAALQTSNGKIFAGCYAIFSGIALSGVLGIIFAPVVHRFLHKFHQVDKKAERDAG